MHYNDTVMIEACVDAELRERAEGILTQLGMTASTAITFFYHQIVLQKGLPFLLKLPPVPDTEEYSVTPHVSATYTGCQIDQFC